MSRTVTRYAFLLSLLLLAALLPQKNGNNAHRHSTTVLTAGVALSTSPLMLASCESGEQCNGLDDDGDGEVDEGWDATDNDGDGVTTCTGDCDDTDPSIFIGAPEVCYDGKDNDCSGAADDHVDADGDGVPACIGGDCDDTNVKIYPTARDTCGDGIDSNCDGADVFTYFIDADKDLYGSASATKEGCALPSGYRAYAGDCDDTNPQITKGVCPDTDTDGDTFSPNQGDCDDFEERYNPGATEICGGVTDNNCDGIALNCGPNFDDDYDEYTENEGDCEDDNGSVSPWAWESCYDDLDNDCSGVVNDANNFPDADGDGDGAEESIPVPGTCDPPQGWSIYGMDCDDTDPEMSYIYGVDDTCDGKDNDCDGCVDSHDDDGCEPIKTCEP